MKNPVNLEAMWAAAANAGSAKVMKAMAKAEKANREAFAAWVEANRAAWSKPFNYENPAAALAAA